MNCGVGFTAKFSFWQNLYIKLCPDKNKRHSYRNWIVDTQKAKRLEPIIAKENPDVIISFNAEATRVLKLHMNVKCPVITMFHFNPEHIFSNCTDDTRNALEMSDCIQVLMPSFVEKTKEYIAHKNIVCISNTVPQYELINEIENNRKNIIVNLARIDREQKRQHIIIEAFAMLAKDFPNWTVEFWGEKDSDIKYYNYCQSLIKKHSLESKIIFRGTTKNVESVLKSAKIFAFPSAFEGFSLALTEAMSAGLPSIGCKDGVSVNELIVDGENGFLTDPNANSYADKLRTLMENDNLRKKMGICAKRSIVKYAPDNIWDEWEKLVNLIVNVK